MQHYRYRRSAALLLYLADPGAAKRAPRMRTQQNARIYAGGARGKRTVSAIAGHERYDTLAVTAASRPVIRGCCCPRTRRAVAVPRPGLDDGPGGVVADVVLVRPAPPGPALARLRVRRRRAEGLGLAGGDGGPGAMAPLDNPVRNKGRYFFRTIVTHR